MNPKPIRVDELVQSIEAKAWRKLKLREGTRGDVKAKVLHLRVWVWDGKHGEPRRWHLIVRRQTSQKGLKFSLSNAHHETTTKTLAYWQSQRQWVKRAIRDAKQEVGLADAQVRTWRAWHHHATLSMMAGMWLFRTRIECGVALPLLTNRDVRDMLAMCLATGMSSETMTRILVERHQRRRLAIKAARARPKKT